MYPSVTVWCNLSHSTIINCAFDTGSLVSIAGVPSYIFCLAAQHTSTSGSSSGCMLAATCSDGMLRIWDAGRGHIEYVAETQVGVKAGAIGMHNSCTVCVHRQPFPVNIVQQVFSTWALTPVREPQVL